MSKTLSSVKPLFEDYVYLSMPTTSFAVPSIYRLLISQDARAYDLFYWQEGNWVFSDNVSFETAKSKIDEAWYAYKRIVS